MPSNYPFLPAEMVAAMQPADDTTKPAPEPTKARGRRRAEDRMRRPGENTAHQPSEDR